MTRAAEQVKEFVTKIAEEYKTLNFDHNEGAKGSTVGMLNRVCGSNGRRHLILKYLFGCESSKMLTDSQWYALMRWVDSNDVCGVWLPQADFGKEVESVIAVALGENRVEQLPMSLGFGNNDKASLYAFD